MKIHTRVVLSIATGDVLEDEFTEYDGPMALCCGATAAQNQALSSQTSITSQVMQQGSQVFGSDSQVFNDLVSSMAPTVAAGPNQQGFSAAENANLQSSAITQSGQAYKNAEAATGDAIASTNGGNSSLPAGAETGVNENLASSAAANTSGELSQINLANYQQGQQNYNTAVSGLESAPGVFSSATSLDNAASSAASGEASTANQIASQNNSWIQGVTGALGSVAGASIQKFG
jgi:hypothetical protein